MPTEVAGGGPFYGCGRPLMDEPDFSKEKGDFD
jgi:hypothetical protein